MNRLALWLAISACVMPAAVEGRLSPASQGEVTLDWQKFNDLWTKMQQMQKQIEDLQRPENTPPVAYTISQAVYKGSLAQKIVEWNALFEIDVYEKKQWVTIPFMPSSLALRTVKLDGSPVGVAESNGAHAIMLKGQGRHLLSASFTLRAPEEDEAPALTFPVVETPMTILSMSFPRKNISVTVEPAQGVQSQLVEGSRTVVTASLPPTSQISLRWTRSVPEDTAPAKLTVETENRMTISEGLAQMHALFHYTILHRGVRALQLTWPKQWNVTAVQGDGIQEWKRIDTPQGPVLSVQFDFVKKGALDLAVELERNLPESESVVEWPGLAPMGVEREQGVVGVEAKGSVELEAKDSESMNAIDPQELPATVSNSASWPILYAFRYTKTPKLSIAFKRPPEVAVLTTTIDDANAVTLLTDRGQMITRVRFTVRNHLKPSLTVQLPQGAELWSAFVAGVPVKPARMERQSFRIPLAKSQIENGGQQGFPVELVYHLTESKFSLAGLRTAQLAIPDAPISRVIWSLYLPERCRFLYFGGNMENGISASPLSAITGAAGVDVAALQNEKKKPGFLKRLRKEIQQLNAVRAKAAKSQSSVPSNDRPVYIQSEMEAGLLGGASSEPMAAGVYPVAFDVPATGQLFRFGQVMVVGEMPKITMYYLRSAILKTIIFMVLGFILYAIYRVRALWLPRLHSTRARMAKLLPKRSDSRVD